ncbi:MAG TPA: FtsX-like permease family protein [candidate division WOR-3 bacterium]|uniref:FtsX-like permease family protein n=1 Tax=candidate division WOR-3 bacterium TaxID=2052148 RepID=A0A7C5H948_UNCW3|nr:FtsX-like permease family protein [candidate division WOR-3 bacterium]
MVLQKEFTNVLVEPYNKRLQNLEELMRLGNIKIFIFIIIIMIVSAGVIMNTVLTSVFERKKEIGTLRAIGMSKMETFSLIITEVLIVSFISSIVGLIISLLVVNHLMASGISLGSVSGVFEYMDNVIYPVINPFRWIGDTIFVIFFAFLSSLYPVILISRMKPVEALRT